MPEKNGHVYLVRLYYIFYKAYYLQNDIESLTYPLSKHARDTEIRDTMWNTDASSQGKNMIIQKNANIMGKKWKNGRKEEIFIVLGVKKILYFGKMGGGAKISII